MQKKLNISKWLMYLSVAVVLGFQTYWLVEVYQDNYRKLRREVALVLRESLFKDQMQYIVGGLGPLGPAMDTALNGNRLIFIKSDSAGAQVNNFLPATAAGRQDSGAAKPGQVTVVAGYNLAPDTGSPRKGRQRGFMSAFEPRRDAPERYTELTITLPVLPSLFDSAATQSKYKQVLQENKLPHEFILTKGTLPDFGGNNFRGQGRFNIGGTESGRAFQFVGADFHFGNPATYIFPTMLGQVFFTLLITGVLIVSFRFIYGSLKEQWQLSLLKNELISNITHELKTPVATVSVALDALQNFHALNDRERTKEYLAISAAEMKRLSMLIDKVLHFNMFEANKLELHPEPVNLSEITTEAVQTLKPQAEKLHAALQLHLPPEEVWVQGDKLHLLSVLLNLLDNALKYRSQHPVINITLEQDSNYATWHVQDNGPGIAAEYTTRVFDKFFRVPTQDRHNVKGHGLGLSYVKDVVIKHGGAIQVQSQPGKGSIFTVQLPAWRHGT